MEIRIEKYSPELKEAWDNFVAFSKNATFLFYRDFMEYHSQRFTDSSLLFYHRNKLIGLLPANIVDDTLYSHQGLTYGGLILSEHTTAEVVLEIFDALKDYLAKEGIVRLIYKAIPHIYHKLPAEEDLYALFRNGAQLISRSISSCIVNKDRLRFSELRRRGVSKGEKHLLTVRKGDRFRGFWKILTGEWICLIA